MSVPMSIRVRIAFLAVLLGAPTIPVAAAGAEYRIGPEDVLGIVVWDEPKHTMDVQVRPDGMISLPLLNDIAVAGKTPTELRLKLTELLADHVVEPNVTVIVREFNSYKVYFLGEINARGVLVFRRPTRMLQGIATAGGPSQYFKGRVTLVREIGGAEQRLVFNYKKLLDGDAGQENRILLPGDMLILQ